MPVPDFSPGEVLTASAMDSIGLWLVKTTSFTNQATIDVLNCFSNDFQNYRVVISCSTANTANTGVLMRLGNAPSTFNALNYGVFHFYVGSPGSGVFTNNNYTATDILVSQIGGNRQPITSTIDVFNPFVSTERSGYQINSFSSYNSGGVENRIILFGGGSHDSVASYNSLRFFHGTTQNMTGTIRVYGYRN